MALAPRKKRGIGFLIAGVAFLAAGGVFIGIEVTPDWLSISFLVASAIGNVLGFSIVFPDIND